MPSDPIESRLQRVESLASDTQAVTASVGSKVDGLATQLDIQTQYLTERLELQKTDLYERLERVSGEVKAAHSETKAGQAALLQQLQSGFAATQGAQLAIERRLTPLEHSHKRKASLLSTGRKIAIGLVLAGGGAFIKVAVDWLAK